MPSHSPETLTLRPIRIFATLVVMASGVARQGEASEVARDEAIRLAIANSRQLRVAALEIDRAKARLKWAGLLPNPELELSANDDFIGNNDRESSVEIGYTQRFPVTSRLEEEKVLRREQVELAEVEFTIQQRQLAADVDQAWLQLGGARELAGLQNRLLALNGEVVGFLASRAKVGEASSLDVTQAQLNGKQLEQSAALAQANADAAESNLKKLVGIEQSQVIVPSPRSSLPASPPSEPISLDHALKNRPDFNILLYRSKVGKAELALAITSRWEDFAVKAFLQTENSIDEPDGLDRNNFAGISLSIPLPIRTKNQEAVEQAKLELEEVRRTQAAKAFAIRSELLAATKARQNAHKLASEAGGELLVLAKKNFDDFKKAQEIGQATLLQVQQAQRQLLEFETRAVELITNYYLADAKVRSIAGAYPLPSPRPTDSPTPMPQSSSP